MDRFLVALIWAALLVSARSLRVVSKSLLRNELSPERALVGTEPDGGDTASNGGGSFLGNLGQWTATFSEEGEAQSEQFDMAPIGAIMCIDVRCDDKRTKHYEHPLVKLEYETWKWVGWFTSGQAAHHCPPDMYVARISCRDHFCGKMALHCHKAKHITTDFRRKIGEYYGPKDHEGKGKQCPDGYAITGMQCHGPGCHALDFWCSRLVISDVEATAVEASWEPMAAGDRTITVMEEVKAGFRKWKEETNTNRISSTFEYSLATFKGNLKASLSHEYESAIRTGMETTMAVTKSRVETLTVSCGIGSTPYKYKESFFNNVDTLPSTFVTGKYVCSPPGVKPTCLLGDCVSFNKHEAKGYSGVTAGCGCCLPGSTSVKMLGAPACKKITPAREPTTSPEVCVKHNGKSDPRNEVCCAPSCPECNSKQCYNSVKPKNFYQCCRNAIKHRNRQCSKMNAPCVLEA